jgi:hypothetical protein
MAQHVLVDILIDAKDNFPWCAGIPRLREILMVAADNIKTPSMDIPFRPGTTPKQMQALKLK